MGLVSRSAGVSRAGWVFIAALSAMMFALTSGTASAQPIFNKQFSPDTIGPGTTTTLTFTINNSGGGPVTGLAFTDNFPAGVAIASPANAIDTCSSGTLSAPAGGTTVTYSGGQLAAGGTCTISVDVTSSTIGTHTNTSGDLTSSAGNSGPATDDLNVVTTVPGFSKSFSPSSVSLGWKSTLTFTIDNTLNAARIGNLDFTDNLPAGMMVADPSNATTDCIAPSLPNTTIHATPGSSSIVLDANGSNAFAGFETVGAGSSCTVSVDVITTGTGVLNNVTNQLLADFVQSGTASDTLTVNAASLNIAKAFTDDPVVAGNNATLQFVISNYDRNYSATSVAFTDDLTTLSPAMAGVTFAALNSNSCGGSIGGIGGNVLSLSGGTIAPEGSCLIEVAVAVPPATAAGNYTNTSSTVSATVNGSPVVGNAASDTLSVQAASTAPPLLSFDIPDGNAGDTVTASFTVTNQAVGTAATDVSFLIDMIPPFPFPLTTSNLSPSPPCGAGSTFSVAFLDIDDQGLQLSGGSLAAGGGAGDSCTFTLDITLPSDFPGGTYNITSEAPTATIAAATRTGSTASDSFTVNSNLNLSFGKSFTTAVAPGGSVDLTFAIVNPAGSADATAIGFTDDINAMLAGATFGMITTDTCGGTPSGGGTGTFSYSGGTLAAGNSCEITIPVNILALLHRAPTRIHPARYLQRLRAVLQSHTLRLRPILMWSVWISPRNSSTIPFCPAKT